jgi:hypothetical protein
VPQPVLDALNGEIKTLLARDDMKARIADIGAIADYTTPPILGVRAERDREVRRDHPPGKPGRKGRQPAASPAGCFAAPPQTSTRMVATSTRARPHTNTPP